MTVVLVSMTVGCVIGFVLALVLFSCRYDELKKTKRALILSILQWANETGSLRYLAMIASTRTHRINAQHILDAIYQGYSVPDEAVLRLEIIRRELAEFDNLKLARLLESRYSGLMGKENDELAQALGTTRASFLSELEEELALG